MHISNVVALPRTPSFHNVAVKALFELPARAALSLGFWVRAVGAGFFWVWAVGISCLGFGTWGVLWVIGFWVVGPSCFGSGLEGSLDFGQYPLRLLPRGPGLLGGRVE